MDAVFDFDVTSKKDGPYRVSPLRAPSTLQNVDSSYFALKTKSKGPNCTVASGTCGFLQALEVAATHLYVQDTDFGLIATSEIRSPLQNMKNYRQRSKQMSEELGVAVLISKHSQPNSELNLKGEVIASGFVSQGGLGGLTKSLKDQRIENAATLIHCMDYDGATALVDNLSSNFSRIIDITQNAGVFDSSGGGLALMLAASQARKETDSNNEASSVAVLTVDDSGYGILLALEVPGEL